jgi:4-aminobutyrate aminotransferase
MLSTRGERRGAPLADGLGAPKEREGIAVVSAGKPAESTEAGGARLRQGLEAVADRAPTAETVPVPEPMPATEFVLVHGVHAPGAASFVQRFMVSAGLMARAAGEAALCRAVVR